MRAFLLLILALNLLLVSACGSSEPDFYRDHQHEYINIPNLSVSTEKPYIAGKVITVSIEEEEFDDDGNDHRDDNLTDEVVEHDPGVHRGHEVLVVVEGHGSTPC